MKKILVEDTKELLANSLNKEIKKGLDDVRLSKIKALNIDEFIDRMLLKYGK